MSFDIPNLVKVKELFKEYDEITFVKKGGFKAVYRAKMNKTIEALKLAFIPPSDNEDVPKEIQINFVEECKKRIFRELSILSKCTSPYVVKLGKMKPTEVLIDGKMFIAYTEEFLDGKNIQDYIYDHYRPTEKELKILLVCLLKAINELWNSFKAIHRDIKPLNIIKSVDERRPFVLLDLGIAYLLNKTPVTMNPADRMPPGTTQYLAPEMLRPDFRTSIDFRADLYTSGITIYEFACGVHPFLESNEDLIMTLSKIVNITSTPLEERRPDLSIEFCNVINQLLKKMVALRPSNIVSLIKHLEN